jgi:hypothetical protein
VAKLRRYRCASGWLAIVALVGNVLAAFVPAAQIVDDILGPAVVYAADGCAGLQPRGPKPTLPDPTNYPSCTLEKPEKLEKDGAFLGVSPLSEFPLTPQGARKLAGSHTLGDADNLRLGGNRSRAPPPVA